MHMFEQKRKTKNTNYMHMFFFKKYHEGFIFFRGIIIQVSYEQMMRELGIVIYL